MMESNQDSSNEERSLKPLPPNFLTLEQIQQLSSDAVRSGTLASVIGFVKDFQPAFKTRKDYKCTLEIMDYSLRFETYGMKVTIFWPNREDMPEFNLKDLVLIRNAKVQMYQGGLSLLTNLQTTIHQLLVFEVPNAGVATPKAVWKSYPPRKHTPPSAIETHYAIWATSLVGKLVFPSKEEFQEKASRAMNVRDKFCLLKDVKDGGFYNILGEVIKVFDNSAGTTLYLSDYTANVQFFNQIWTQDGAGSDGRDGDEFGYAKLKRKEANAWPGPYGKLCIQLTLFEGHAEFVREHVKVNQWVLLSNVQIGFGKMGGILEGWLRGDRHRFEGKVQVKIMEESSVEGKNDPRWVTAVQRKLDWWKVFSKQRQAFLDEKARLGDKRKLSSVDQPKENRKARRDKQRAAAARKANGMVDVNENIRCAFPDQPVMALTGILKPRKLAPDNNVEDEYPSPFSLGKYRATVRVVDYFPHKLEDFTVGRRARDFDILPDYSGGEDTDLEEDMRVFRSGKGFAKNIWEWRFALQVEDAVSEGAKERLWLMVDNQAAQGLLGLDADASNLRADPELLANMKEQLFKLWGDLEEKKSAALKQQLAKEKITLPPLSSFESAQSTPPPRPGQQPDADSDTESQPSISKPRSKPSSLFLTEPHVKITEPVGGDEGSSETDVGLAPNNKAFTCCIKQYGVKVDEGDRSKANAGEGQRWQRMFALFGTQVI